MHLRLSFGSGAYYVKCLDCHASWKPEDEGAERERCMNNELRYAIDVRVRPEGLDALAP